MNKKIVLIIAMVLFGGNILLHVTAEHNEYSIDSTDIEKDDLPSVFLPYDQDTGWPRQYDGGDDDEAIAMIIDLNDDIIVAGNTYDEEQDRLNIHVIKYNMIGDELWNITYDSGYYDEVYDVTIDTQNNVAILGYRSKNVDAYQNFTGDYCILKFDKDGHKLWNISYITEWKNNFLGGIAVDSMDNIIFTGGTGDFEQYVVLSLTVKVDENGNEIWNQTFREEMITAGICVAVDTTDTIVVGGTYASLAPLNQGYSVLKYNSEGDVFSFSKYAGTEPHDIAVDSQGNTVLTGYGDYTDEGGVIYHLMKCDRSGDLLWSKDIDDMQFDGVTVDSKDTILLAGGYESFGTRQCIGVFDADGEELCLKKTDVPGVLYDIDVNGKDEIFATGFKGGHSSGDFYTTTYEDVSPPICTLKQPKEGYAYLFGNEIRSPLKNTVIIGEIMVRVDVENSSDVEKVEFYIDDDRMKTLTEPPYEYPWDEQTFGRHTIETMVYDQNNNIKRFEIDIWKLL